MHVDIFKNIAGELGKQVAADDRIKNTVIYIVELFERNGLNAVETSVVCDILNSRSKELLKKLLSSKSVCEKECEIKEPEPKGEKCYELSLSDLDQIKKWADCVPDVPEEMKRNKKKPSKKKVSKK